MTQRELTPADYLAMLRRRWVVILLFTIIGGPLAYGVSRLLPSKYVSQTLVLVDPQSVPTDLVRSLDTTNISQQLASMQQEILSRTRLEPIIRQYGLYASDIDRTSMDVLVGRLQGSIEVTPVQPMVQSQSPTLPGFFVKVTLDKARPAQQVCAAITSMFIEESLSLRQQHYQDTTSFLSQQLEESKRQLDEQEAKVAAFESRYSGSLPDEEHTNLNLLTGLTSQLDSATQALARAQQDKSFTESLLTQQLAAWQEAQTGRNPDTLDQQLVALQTQLAGLEARYTDDYPDVIKTKNDIVVLRKKIAENDGPKSAPDSTKPARSSVEPTQITQLRAQIHSYEQAIAEKSKEQEQIKQEIKLYEGRVQATPVVEEQYKQLTRGYQTALESYSELQKNQGEAARATDLGRQSEAEQFRVLDPANLPDRPSYPNRLAFGAYGSAGGLGLGLVLAFLLEMRDTSMRTERDIEFVLRLPVLAMVPEIAPLSGKSVKNAVTGLNPKSSPGLGAGA
jgi:polysaccharide chain length determinant protein (PEP-CTERM system associated)